MSLDWRAAWRAWSSYRGSGPAVQAFLLARMVVAPLGPLDPELRGLRGSLLSVGCGYGVVDRYIAELNPDVTIHGIELDGDRVKTARKTMDRCPRVVIDVGDALAIDTSGTYDGALLVDLLHHVPADTHAGVARSVYSYLKPGGVCLVKEMARTPQRQYLWNRLHDRIVSGPSPIYCRDPEEMAAVFTASGFEIAEVRRMHRLHVYPQYLILARKPAINGASAEVSPA